MNYLSPDGYRYGVMFSDGSVMERWNGRNQRQQAERYLAYYRDSHRRDHITLARIAEGGVWERVDEA